MEWSALPETDPAAQVLSTAQVLIDITTMQRRNWQWLHRPLESTLALAMQHLQMPWEHSHWCARLNSPSQQGSTRGLIKMMLIGSQNMTVQLAQLPVWQLQSAHTGCARSSARSARVHGSAGGGRC